MYVYVVACSHEIHGSNELLSTFLADPTKDADPDPVEGPD